MDLNGNIKRNLVIAVDFDGTLCKHKYPDIGEPNTKLINNLKELVIKKHQLILWTCRDGVVLDEAVAWCKEQGLKLSAVNEDIDSVKKSLFGREKSCKVFADIYLDDRNQLIEKF